MTTVPSLLGHRILVVEDEPLISLDIAQAIEAVGGHVVGPANTVRAAEELARTAAITAAMLDLRLQNDLAMSVADILAERDIPFVFYTGSSKSDVSQVWPDAMVVLKPSGSKDLVAALRAAIRKAQGTLSPR